AARGYGRAATRTYGQRTISYERLRSTFGATPYLRLKAIAKLLGYSYPAASAASVTDAPRFSSMSAATESRLPWQHSKIVMPNSALNPHLSFCWLMPTRRASSAIGGGSE